MKTATIVRLKTEHATVEAERTSVTGSIALRLQHDRTGESQVIISQDDFREWLDDARALV